MADDGSVKIANIAAEIDTKMDVKSANSVKKKTKKGVIFLSTIPPTFNKRNVKEFFENYGAVGRVHLAVNERRNPRAKFSSLYSEGWVEFLDKRVAKQVAVNLNVSQVGITGNKKKKAKAYDTLWSIKYLHRFKWGHLMDQMQHEQAEHSQRMRSELAQAKRETNFYVEAVQRNDRQKRWTHGPRAATAKNVPQRQSVVVDGQPETTPDGSTHTANKSVAPDLALLRSIFASSSFDQPQEDEGTN